MGRIPRTRTATRQIRPDRTSRTINTMDSKRTSQRIANGTAKATNKKSRRGALNNANVMLTLQRATDRHPGHRRSLILPR